MYKFALLIGLYSYSLFAVGLLGLLNMPSVSLLSVFFIIGFMLLGYKAGAVRKLLHVKDWFIDKTTFEKAIIFIICAQIIVNFIGVLGPELGFDALWYHLTIPKVFAFNERVFYIPGDLLYYSVMPKLIDMLYVLPVMLGSDLLAKLIHFLFGLGTLFVLYRLARQFVSETLALVCVLVFYSNLVVGWLSITAYIDLGRIFFTALALFYFLEFVRKNRRGALIISAVMMGLAISTKVISLLDISTFVFLLVVYRRSLRNVFLFVVISLVIPLPWFIFSYLSTGNLFYPFFSKVVSEFPVLSLSSLSNFIHSSDPLSPIYLILLPLAILTFRHFKKDQKIIIWYCAISFFIWFISPQTGGGRFIAAYLPAFSLLALITISHVRKNFLHGFYLGLILMLGIISVFYRGAANAEYIPVIAGIESRSDFLSKNLNFNFGDFYDTDGYLDDKVKKSRVLIIGGHNLYYVNFPFVHESWLDSDDKFEYILTQNTDLPNKYKRSKLEYESTKTNVKLYKAL